AWCSPARAVCPCPSAPRPPQPRSLGKTEDDDRCGTGVQFEPDALGTVAGNRHDVLLSRHHIGGDAARHGSARVEIVELPPRFAVEGKQVSRRGSCEDETRGGG